MDSSATRLTNKLGRTRSEEDEHWVFRFENGLVVYTDPFMAKDRARILPIGGPQDTILNHLLWFPEKVRGKRVFDPFAGSGILGLMALRLGAAHVDFLDVNPRACEFQRSNASRNRFPDTNYQTHLESIEVFEPRQPYDIILANPPFVPTPPGIEGTLTSAAGPLGNTLLDLLLARLDRWLLPLGEAFIYVMQFVAETGPLVTRRLLKQLPERAIAFTPTQVEGIPFDIYCEAYRKCFAQQTDAIDRWRSELLREYGPLDVQHYVMHVGPKRPGPAEWTITPDLAAKYGTLPYPALANAELALARALENFVAPGS